MAITPEQKEQVHNALRHPVTWLKGEGLPEEQLRPWELAVHIVPNLITGLRNGFTWNILYLFQNVFGVDKRQQTVAAVSSTLWDGINDPIIGAYMDSRNIPVSMHRWICRVQTLVGSLLTLLPMFSFGLTPWQHVAMYIACRAVSDVFGTASTVSSAKIFAHITPYSDQRARLAWAQGIGTTIHEMLLPVYILLVGLREVLGWSEYHIYIFGAVLLTLPAMALELGPTFVLQRVPDKAQGTKMSSARDFFAELKECFLIVRHNKYFMLDLAARFVTVLTPGITDNDFYRYCGVDEVLKTGKIKGEFLL